MKGKTVVITGGISGIGEIAAELLAQMDARIVLVARDRSRGDRDLADSDFASSLLVHEPIGNQGHHLPLTAGQ
jgi:NAD(P)-dependent dehydrogenase (short-subunit alcohol dehydrogenase family)